ncbi:MAG TPA: LysE family translocator [Aliidongia sp.]|uniref:LysE family translocator n=1 Tax=Aliidongia sp. TaxID=1914230 RepID=UPI002DDC91DF|nr:LysE family translocator [Aliidongia sp.]HEV2677016.1 LysE family translocator [Aliidongia sp.]
MPVTLSTILLFAAASLALAVTPGPDMLMCLSRSIAQGRQTAFAALSGIVTGCYVWAFAAAFGLASLLALSPTAYDVVRFAGAAYLAYLAWQTFRAKDAFGVSSGLPSVAWGRAYRQGLMTNLLNPKIALFFLALFPQFVDPAHGNMVAQALILVSVFNVIGFGINGSVILAASRFASFLARRPGVARLQRWFLGTVFGGLALRLALDDRH